LTEPKIASWSKTISTGLQKTFYWIRAAS